MVAGIWLNGECRCNKHLRGSKRKVQPINVLSPELLEILDRSLQIEMVQQNEKEIDQRKFLQNGDVCVCTCSSAALISKPIVTVIILFLYFDIA